MPRAPRRCPHHGCTTLIRHTKYCTEHTVAWAGPRTASSTATSQHAWRTQVVPAILRRDGYHCQINTPGICTHVATTVDKIQPAARRPDLTHTGSNLRAACTPCNMHKARTTDRT